MVIVMIPKQLTSMRFNRVTFKEKRAFEKGWQNNPYSYDEIQKYFPKENYGVMCGKEVRVLDDDTPKKGLIKLFIDNFGETFRVRDHLYFRFDNGYDKKIIFTNNILKFEDGKGGTTNHMGELQGEGTYVVGAGSTHPDGSIYEVKNNCEIKTISYNKFLEVFGEYINGNTENKIKTISYNISDDDFIKSIKENWNKGNRQDLAMSVAGYLRKEKRLGLDSALSIVENICKDCNDEELNQRLNAVRSTYNKDEDKIKGYTGLIENKVNLEKNYNDLQKEVFTLLALKDRDAATELIVKQIEEDNYIYTTKDDIKSEMWIYEEGIYVPQGKSFVKEFSRKILDKAYTTQLSNAIISKIEADTFIEHDKFFNTNIVDEIPLLNGILNIRTREISNHTPNKIFFNKLPIKYDETKDCPNIKNHFKSILRDKESVDVMMEIFGYLLLKEYKIEKAFMFVGFGRNGKSKTIELMKRFIGAENCSSLPLRSLTEESFSLSELFGRMANLAADLSKTDLKETGMIKSLIGRDTIQAKRKYLRDLNFVNYAKMVFAANELPKIYDTTDGFWTKWVLLEFPYKFVTEEVYENSPQEERGLLKIMNPDIMEELTKEEELSGLLNFALDGLDNLLDKKDFSYSKSTADVKDMWIRKSDSFTAFCYDHVVDDDLGKVTKKEMRRIYHKYTKKHKVPSCSDKAIKITIENMFGAGESQDSFYDRVWEGIKLVNLEELLKV